MSLEAASLSSVVPDEVHDVGELHDVGLITCVGQAIVQGDEGPVGGVAQGVQVHGVVVRHGEKQEKEEGEVEQEVEGEKEENAQTTMRMSMDGMRVKRQMRSALSLEPL